MSHWPPLLRTDRSIADDLNRWIAPHPDGVTAWKVITNGLQPLTWEILGAAVVVVLFVRHHRRVAVFVALAVAGTVGLYDLVKAAVGRHRPTVPAPLLHPYGASFPSGHAMMSATAMTLVALACWHTVRRAAALVAAVAGAALVAAAVAASRLVLGAHYLSDVIGSWLLAGAWVSALVAAFGLRVERPVSPPGRSVAGPARDPRPGRSTA